MILRERRWDGQSIWWLQHGYHTVIFLVQFSVELPRIAENYHLVTVPGRGRKGGGTRKAAGGHASGARKASQEAC